MKPMGSLLLKDCYMLKRTACFLLAMTVLFQAMPGSGMFLALFYSLLLPNSAFSYDDRSRWGELAAVLPYSVRDLVWSRYLLSWGSVLVFQTAGFLARNVFAAVGIASPVSGIPGLDGIGGFALLVGFSLLFHALALPISFRFDAEKSTLVRTLIVVLLCGFSGAAIGLAGAITRTGLPEGMEVRLSPAFCGIVWAAAAVLTAGSIPLSMAAYRARRR